MDINGPRVINKSIKGTVYVLLDTRKLSNNSEFNDGRFKFAEEEIKAAFYVGITTCSLEHRLTEHIYDARQEREKNIRKERKIRAMLKLGLRPIIKIMETTEDLQSLKEKEKYWIKELRERYNAPLLNVNPGGDWNPMTDRSEKEIKTSIEKMRKTQQKKRQELAESLGLTLEELREQSKIKIIIYRKEWIKETGKAPGYTRKYREKLKQQLGEIEFKKLVAFKRRKWYANLSPEQKEVQRQKDRLYRKKKREQKKMDIKLR